MPSFKQGDIIRVPFPYTDRATRQRRPALVVSMDGIGEDRGLLWVVMITSAENRSWLGDISLGELFVEAGLPAPSVIRPCKIATIEARYAEHLGQVKPQMMAEVTKALRHLLGI